MLLNVLAAYGLEEDQSTLLPFGTGLINHTWKVSTAGRDYILQQINHEVFHEPAYIAGNIDAVGAWLRQHHPEYLFISPLPALDGNSLVRDARGTGGYFRLSPFVTGSHTCDVVQTPQLAYEAAQQFGLFTRLLACFPADSLHITLPDFHNLALRYLQFETALEQGDPARIAASQGLIDGIRTFSYIVDQFTAICNNPGFSKRVTHHDTKISNVLLDKDDKGLCVIDLDTVMPGYFISDLGDMMRTYLSPVSEEE